MEPARIVFGTNAERIDPDHVVVASAKSRRFNINNDEVGGRRNHLY